MSGFTPTQIDTYLSHISIPAAYRLLPTPNIPLTLDFLRLLQTHQLITCPYENLSIHYSPAHAIALDPHILFRKIVLDKRGRGGYCMENSILFFHMLHGLGFNVYMTGARGRRRQDGVPHGAYYGWMHMVNIVTLPTGRRYAVDIAFGGDGPIEPLPMVCPNLSPGEDPPIESYEDPYSPQIADDVYPVLSNIGTQQVRLIKSHIPDQISRHEGNRLWIYQYRNEREMQWNSNYSFSELEFQKDDFGIMSYWTSTNAESLQTTKVMVVKFLGREKMGSGGKGAEEGEMEMCGNEIYGKVMMAYGTVKLNEGGKTRVVKVCETEEERVEALKEWFGIKLTEEEVSAIKGWRTELVPCSS